MSRMAWPQWYDTDRMKTKWWHDNDVMVTIGWYWNGCTKWQMIYHDDMIPLLRQCGNGDITTSLRWQRWHNENSNHDYIISLYERGMTTMEWWLHDYDNLMTAVWHGWCDDGTTANGSDNPAAMLKWGNNDRSIAEIEWSLSRASDEKVGVKNLQLEYGKIVEETCNWDMLSYSMQNFSVNRKAYT